MKKYFYIMSIILLLTGIYFFNSTNNINNPLQNQTSIINTKHSLNTTKTNKQKEINKNITNNKTTKEISQNEYYNKPHLREEIYSKKISNFIKNNNLQPVQKIKDVEIFVKNSPIKSEFTPPSPPTLIKVVFKNNSIIIPLNSSLINTNKTIYIIKKQKDKYTSIKKIDTENLKSFIPPQIGQN